MAVAYRMLGSQEAAEDVVQEAFIRMWKNARKWQPGAARFSTWLHRVTINLCYDRLRKASTRHEYAAGDDLPDLPDEGADKVHRPSIPEMFEIDDRGGYRIKATNAH